MKKFVIISEKVRESAISFIRVLPLEPASAVTITEHKSKRSVEQNALMWKLLTDLSNQVDWYGQILSPDDWKCVMTAGLKKFRVVPDIDGTGFVSIGAYTSKMNVQEMNDLILLIESFGAEKGVKWTAPKEYWDEPLPKK